MKTYPVMTATLPSSVNFFKVGDNPEETLLPSSPPANLGTAVSEAYPVALPAAAAWTGVLTAMRGTVEDMERRPAALVKERNAVGRIMLPFGGLCGCRSAGTSERRVLSAEDGRKTVNES